MYFKVLLIMEKYDEKNSIEALNDIKRIMEQSTRFLSLSGWSGIWAGLVAVIGGAIGYYQLSHFREQFGLSSHAELETFIHQLILLAFAILALALLGAYYFTVKKIKRQGLSMWNKASKNLLLNIAIPLVAGAILILGFIIKGDWEYIAPATLIFYGLALINGSKYTLNDIRFLGFFELLLGCICIFVPYYGLFFWIIGFGVLHIVYGLAMWRKYDRVMN